METTLLDMKIKNLYIRISAKKWDLKKPKNPNKIVTHFDVQKTGRKEN